MQSFLSAAGVAVLGVSLWYELKWLPQEPPIPLACVLFVYGVVLITTDILLDDKT